jgi:hypothetical protein
MTGPKNISTQTFLKISVILVLIGRGYQYLFFSAPFMSLYYYAEFLKPYVEEKTGMLWHDFLSLPEIDNNTDAMICSIGSLFLITIPFIFLLKKKNYVWPQLPILASGIGLIFLAVLLTITKNYKLGQFMEYSIQFTSPFLLLSFIKYKWIQQNLLFILKLLIALTFVGHGLYAIGYYPVPGYFVDMVIRIFKCSESFARTFLTIAGILDMMLAIGLFLPNKSIVKYCLLWAVIWGFSTAIARVVGNYYPDFIMRSLHQTIYEMAYRLPHGLLPVLGLLLLDRKSCVLKKKTKKSLKTFTSLEA